MVRAWLELEEGGRVPVRLPANDVQRLLGDQASAAGETPRGLVVCGEELPPLERRFDPTARPIEEIIAEIASRVPAEEWDNLPDDPTGNLGHYIYGTPKR